MDKFGIVVLGMAVVCVIAYCAHAVPPAQEMQIAEAYHCGMLDAMQVKIKRGRACDEYKAIAKKKGVEVPP